jgi:hypothetical protein
MAALESSIPPMTSMTVPLTVKQVQAAFHHYLIFLAGEHFCLFVDEESRKAPFYEDGLLAVLRYITKHEPKDRQVFAEAVAVVHELVGRYNTKRAATFKKLPTMATRLTKEHMGLSEADRVSGIDHLDKFGLLFYFMDTKSWTVTEGASWDNKLENLQAFNTRWTESLVKETLGRLRFANKDSGRQVPPESQPPGRLDAWNQSYGVASQVRPVSPSETSDDNKQPLALLRPLSSAPRAAPAAQAEPRPAAAAAPAAPAAATADVRKAPGDAPTGQQQAPLQEPASALASAAASAGASAAPSVASAAAAPPTAPGAAPVAATADVREAPGDAPSGPDATSPVIDAAKEPRVRGRPRREGAEATKRPIQQPAAGPAAPGAATVAASVVSAAAAPPTAPGAAPVAAPADVREAPGDAPSRAGAKRATKRPKGDAAGSSKRPKGDAACSIKIERPAAPAAAPAMQTQHPQAPALPSALHPQTPVQPRNLTAQQISRAPLPARQAAPARAAAPAAPAATATPRDMKPER